MQTPPYQRKSAQLLLFVYRPWRGGALLDALWALPTLLPPWCKLL